MNFRYCWILPLLGSGFSSAQVPADGSSQATENRPGVYRTREDRREAGLGTELTDWLTFSGLVESETIREVTQFDNTLADHYDWETEPTVQAAFDISLLDVIEAELILEYTEEPDAPLMDELIIGTDLGDWGFSVGRYYVPFGLYYSHFVNGPIMEVAETRSDVFQVDYDFNDIAELSLFTYDPLTRRAADLKKKAGWGAAVEAALLNGRMLIGGGYLSNLADSEEELLREDFQNVYSNRVGAWNAYLVYEADTWDISMEVLKATGSFREFDTDRNRPQSWNLEMAWYPSSNLELAARYERSDELVDEPEKVYGVALTWRFLGNISTTLEYLKSDFRRGFVEEDDDIFVTRGNTLAFWFAFEF